MHRIIIILIALTAFIPECFSQQTDALLLLSLEQKAFACPLDSTRTDFFEQKLDLYLKAGEYSPAALAEAKRIDYLLLKDKAARNRFLWNAALLAQMNNDYNYARIYYDRYQAISFDSSGEAGLLDILIKSNTDTLAVTASILALAKKDRRFECLSCMNKTLGYKRRNKGLFILSSVLVPGLGSMENGYFRQGITSLAINGVIGYVIYTLIRSNDYVNAAMLGLSLGLKFYSGNIRLTDKLFEEKQVRKKSLLAKDCKQALEQLLKKYPLNFR
jgi:TM2 domain-containing membrane protein YozV